MQARDPAVITVLCAGAMRPIMRDLAPAFERITGQRISLAFTRSGLVRDRVRDGELADVVITTRAAIDHLVGLGKVIADSALPVAHSGIGVAIREGAARPDIGSAAAFQRALRDAKSIAYADPATGSPSGNYLVALFDRLGLSAELKPKTRLVGADGSEVVGRRSSPGETRRSGFSRSARSSRSPGWNWSGRCPPNCSRSPPSRPRPERAPRIRLQRAA